MEIASIYDNIEYGDKNPAIKILIDCPHTKEIRITFRKGQVMKEHKAGYPIVVAVIEGCINFGIGQERQILKKGMMISLSANIPHDLIAENDSIVRLSLNKSDNIERIKNI